MQFFSKSFLLTLGFNAVGFIPTTDAIGFKPQHLHRRDVTPTGISFIYANSTKIECYITHVLELQGAGQIDMRDCRMMVKNFEDDGHYLMMASGWQSSISLREFFSPLSIHSLFCVLNFVLFGLIRAFWF